MDEIKLLILPGDGIGPETVKEVKKIISFFNKTGISQKMGAQNPYWKFVLGMCKHDKLLLYYNIIRFSFSKKDVLMC